ncbi:RtcB family protein [Apibacter raozihei]|uniref:RtcB family protein n=1 Tax=Apibacter raozihei TaxID=2500547 RepID=UPI000FE2B488|nr:RtcB family protein [Apibacter raozihei]
MGKLKLKGKDILKIGYPNTKIINTAIEVMQKNFDKRNKAYVLSILKDIQKKPEEYKENLMLGQIAEEFLQLTKVEKRNLESQRAPFTIFGEEQIAEEAIKQLYTALKLPVSVQGALMPDGHVGYGLPIGGVLATENAIIPYGVGVDIGCRMCLSILDIPVSYLEGSKDKYLNALQENTKFGMYETHKTHIEYLVFENEAFSMIPILRRLKAKAIKQMGTSGGGNHFVEFGEVEITDEKNEFNLPKGKYTGILSHSGSRALGAEIAQYYTRVAIEQCPLPKEAQHLAWLDLNSHLGTEYWIAMNLAGEYASACHSDIHRRLMKITGGRLVARIENHHNFAWKEEHKGKEVIVHRKGATPAAEGQLGFIPGSMSSKGFIVRGRGNEESLNSASHGAGRLLSRHKASNSISASEIKKELKLHKVELIGGSKEEAPMAYKNINEVMNAQTELVDILGTFMPRLVRMDKK